MTPATGRSWASTFAATFLAGALAACSPEAPVSKAPGAPAQGSAPGARLEGTVRFEGTPPAARPLRFDADPQCAAVANGLPASDRAVLVSEDGGVQNVFVYLAEGASPERTGPPPAPAVLDQQRCQYVPRVSGVQTGQTLIIRNSDPLLHTVRADARENARFNVATPVRGMEVKRTWDTPEVMVPIGCDMHPWMHAYVGVLDHPYFAVTGADGSFAITGVPPGTYSVAVWHERFGTKTSQIVVGDAGAGRVTFTFDGSSAPLEH